MKLVLALCLSLMYSISGFSQQPLKLSVLKGAEFPNSVPENYYLLKITNTDSAELEFTIATDNKGCVNAPLPEVELNQSVLDNLKSNTLNSIKLQSGEELTFYLKIFREVNTPKNRWNCTEVKAVLSNGSQISNALTIESLIPSSQNQF
jgi:uncharacterized membrane protein